MTGAFQKFLCGRSRFPTGWSVHCSDSRQSRVVPERRRRKKKQKKHFSRRRRSRDCGDTKRTNWHVFTRKYDASIVDVNLVRPEETGECTNSPYCLSKHTGITRLQSCSGRFRFKFVEYVVASRTRALFKQKTRNSVLHLKTLADLNCPHLRFLIHLPPVENMSEPPQHGPQQ